MSSGKRVVVIHQPDFMPWTGFFHRWQNSDLYVVLDNVQFLRRGWHHRDKIKTGNGWQWLTVPVIKKNKFRQLISETEIDNTRNWRDKHLKTIEMNYKKAPAYKTCFDEIKKIYDKGHRYLIDLNMELLRFMSGGLGITTPFIFASSYNVESDSTARLVELTKAVGGTHYLTGIGSKNYLDESLFEKNEIEVIWQQFQPPVYNQLHGEFIPMLSTLDYLLMGYKKI